MVTAFAILAMFSLQPRSESSPDILSSEADPLILAHHTSYSGQNPPDTLGVKIRDTLPNCLWPGGLQR